MAEQSPQSSKKRIDKRVARELQKLEERKTAVQEIAKAARSSLLSIKNSEKQSTKELQKIEKSADLTYKSFHKEVKDLADKTKGDITSAFIEVDTVRGDAKTSYNRFKRTYHAALNSDKTGIIARRNDIADRHDKIKLLHAGMQGLNKDALAYTGDIKKASENAASDSQQINAVKDRAEEIKTEIEKTFHLTTDNTMRGALTERKDEINDAMKFWRWVLILSAIALVGAIAYLLFHQPEGSFMDNLASRLIYVTPLLLLIALAYRQYNHERRILEEYAFKAVMAQTLRNYAVLLSDNYRDAEKAQDKILNFLLVSMGNIYDRSVLDNQSGFFYQFIVGNKKLGAQATLQEGTLETKQTSKEKITTTKAKKQA